MCVGVYTSFLHQLFAPCCTFVFSSFLFFFFLLFGRTHTRAHNTTSKQSTTVHSVNALNAIYQFVDLGEMVAVDPFGVITSLLQYFLRI